MPEQGSPRSLDHLPVTRTYPSPDRPNRTQTGGWVKPRSTPRMDSCCRWRFQDAARTGPSIRGKRQAPAPELRLCDGAPCRAEEIAVAAGTPLYRGISRSSAPRIQPKATQTAEDRAKNRPEEEAEESLTHDNEAASFEVTLASYLGSVRLMASHDAANTAPDDSAESQTGHEEANDDTPPLHAAPLRFTGSWWLYLSFNHPILPRSWAWRQHVNRGKATHFERRNYSSCKLVEAATRSRRGAFPMRPPPRGRRPQVHPPTPRRRAPSRICASQASSRSARTSSVNTDLFGRRVGGGRTRS